MPEAKTISLLIPPEPSPRNQDLQAQIQQIVSQRGHFRHVTEESLRAEILGKKSATDISTSDAPIDEVADDDQDETPQKRQERLWKRRDEMLEKLSYAQNEVLCALDFVSLLISKQSIPAQSSMSPALKEAAPIGSLATHVLQNKSPSAPVQKQLTLMSQGWKSLSFRSASEKLSTASARLQADAERESKYWAQIADLTTRGWPVSRLPRDSKAIVVHYGFAEAAPQFRDRGFALLRQSEDGTVHLEDQRRRKHLGVHLIREGKKTGTFYLRPAPADQTTIDQQISHARDSLFDEELFYETGREARLIANQGVAIRGQQIEIDIESGCQISLSLSEECHDVDSHSLEDNKIAEFVALSLRLFLNAAHQQNLARRSRKPPTMTLKSRATPEYALIRPILTQLRHRSQLKTFRASCHALIQPFSGASLPVNLATEDGHTEVFSSLKIESSATILSDLMLPARTGLSVTLNDDRKLQMGLATFLGPPLYGTRFETSRVAFDLLNIPPSYHETTESVLSFIRHILLLDLVQHVAKLLGQVPREASVAGEAKSKQWKVSNPHSGELTLYDSGEALRRIHITVQVRCIGIKAQSNLAGEGSKPTAWYWTQQGASKIDEHGVAEKVEVKFDDVVREILSLP